MCLGHRRVEPYLWPGTWEKLCGMPSMPLAVALPNFLYWVPKLPFGALDSPATFAHKATWAKAVAMDALHASGRGLRMLL